MKLSIIIPVYRVETTLDRCVESIMNQNLDDFEIILVDDGSPDNCPKMCDDWAERDTHISVIHQQNRGLSDARNAGIDTARGDYITFVDSDDYITGHTYPELMHILADDSEIDILEYPTREFDFYPQTIYTNMEDYWYLSKAYLHTYACNKIYRKELFADIRYPKGKVFEDACILPRLLQKTRKVVTTPTGHYFYTENPQGITAKADGEALNMLLQTHTEIIAHSTRRDAAFQQYYMHVLNIQMDVCELTGRKPVLPKIHIAPCSVGGVMKLKAVALNTLGLSNVCKLNKFIHRLWRNRS